MSVLQYHVKTRSQTKHLKNSCTNNSSIILSSKSKMKRETIDEKHLNNLYTTTEINFDEASQEWHSNKKRTGYKYVYICTQPIKSGKLAGQPCGKVCYKNGLYCFAHKNTIETK